MLSVRVRTRKTDDVAGKTLRGVRRGMRKAADVGFSVSQEHAPVDRGELRFSGVPPTWVGDTLVWGYRSEHAPYVESGTRPHWPPIEPLKGWARRVLGDESAAYAVQATIAERGTPAQPFVKPGFDAMVRELRAAGLGEAIGEEL